MKIDLLIDKDYLTVSILEDTRQMHMWFAMRDYYAVMDEHLKVVGIITPKDVENTTHQQVIDCDFLKPVIAPGQTVFEALELMKQAQTECLPVYDGDDFAGVLYFRFFADV
ncbi:CBS domain-containing protein [Mucilaginibacter dorajii]|uniref:CBS domain-containing protein n=1 Tax=Mucilaginibacter dorajii TaxID=692994 RepID=A0ABP7P637_9SPHI|nr:CBS domain-containing protein [Mucilaginibacter dorajii]MCS3734558.1 CBS domain-containing protein [Mucilaginibacter dorajii]